jgi:hypothetical protein
VQTANRSVALNMLYPYPHITPGGKGGREDPIQLATRSA